MYKPRRVLKSEYTARKSCQISKGFKSCGNLRHISNRARKVGKHFQIHTLQDRVDHLESLIDLLADLGAGQNDLAADENQEDDLGLDHAVDETREQLGFVRTEVVMARGQAFETNRELDVAAADNVLDLEVAELGVEAKLLDDTSVLAGRELRVVLGLGTGHNHLARGEDESGRLRFTDSHDDSGETLGLLARCCY